MIIGELLSTIGLILSGQGLISSIKTSSQILELADRVRESESKLSSLCNDVAFISANMQVLQDLHHLLMSLVSDLAVDVKYEGSRERITQFAGNPTSYGAQSFKPWPLFVQTLPGNRESLLKWIGEHILICYVDERNEIQASQISRKALQLTDIFEAKPVVTFDPSSIKPLVDFLVAMDLSRDPRDEFEVAFEEEM